MEEKLYKKHDELWEKAFEGMSKYSTYSKYETEMKKSAKSTKMFFLIIALFAIVLLVKLNNGSVNMDLLIKVFPIIIFVCIIILVISFPLMKRYGGFSKIYKNEVMIPLIKELNRVKEIDFSKGINSKKYQEADFDDKYYNLIYGSNYIKARTEYADIEIDSTKIEYEDYDYEQNKTTNVTRFEGMFVVGELDKKITDEYIHIFTDKDDKNMKRKEKEGKVKMDSIEFEQNFDIYSTDPIKALMILTPDIMQKLLEEKQRINCKFDVSITKNTIYMRVHNSRKLFLAINGLNENEGLRDKTINDIKMIDKTLDFIDDLSKDIYSKI